MKRIEVSRVTKDYGHGKGVFDISFSVEQGEVLGFLGPNGAGKTTTIRQLMGFTRPDSGTVHIDGKDCFDKAQEIQKNLGYLPGEIAFPEGMRGLEFLCFMAGMKGMQGMGRASELMERFELDPSGKLTKMSKGMKQKVGIVCAFMHDPDILLLDEPTSGLDPLMQNRFIELVLEEKERGKTVLMSSHLFEETERTCGRAAIIREGRIAGVEDMDHLRGNRKKHWEIEFVQEKDAEGFAGQFPEAVRRGVTVALEAAGGADAVIKALSGYTVRDISTRSQTLEELFLGYYGKEGQK